MIEVFFYMVSQLDSDGDGNGALILFPQASF